MLQHNLCKSFINTPLYYNWSCWCWNRRPDILLLYCNSSIHGICLSWLAFWSHCKTVVCVGKNRWTYFSRTRNAMSVSYCRTFKHNQSVVKRSPNGSTGAKSSAVLPGSSCLFTSSLMDLIHSSLINLETLKYFSNSQLKLLNFQTPVSGTAWSHINRILLIDNQHYFSSFLTLVSYHCICV